MTTSARITLGILVVCLAGRFLGLEALGVL